MRNAKKSALGLIKSLALQGDTVHDYEFQDALMKTRLLSHIAVSLAGILESLTGVEKENK